MNINSLTTKFNALEKLSPKTQPLSKSGRDEVSVLSKEPKSSKDVKASPKSFSEELKARDASTTSVSSKPETKPIAGIKPAPTAKGEEIEPKADPLVPSQVSAKKEISVDTNGAAVSETQQPILKFLDSMERELGIAPEQVLAAFAAMSGEALVLPPEQSTQEFVQALNLSQSQESKAMSLYTGLLEELNLQDLKKQQVSQKEGFINLNPNEWDMIPDQKALPRDWKAQKTSLQNQSISDISNKFFNAKADAATELQPELLSTQGFKYPLTSEEVAAQNQLLQTQGDLASFDVPDLPEAEGLDMSKITLNPKSETSLLQMTSGQSETGFDLNAESKGEFETLSGEVIEGGDEFVSLNANGTAPTTKLKMEAVAMQPVITVKEPIEPKEVVQKADLLIQKGGGEMKMKLAPEGLGELHLKVVLKEGKVDVQMITESQQAKKVLESELQSLKAVLAEGRMDLKDVKVDVSQNLGRQMQEQMADQQREHARQFLGYFRENFGSGRNAMAYSQGVKTNNSQDPDDAVRASSQQRRANREPGRLSVMA